MPWNVTGNIRAGSVLYDQRTADTASISSVTLVDVLIVTLPGSGTYVFDALVNMQPASTLATTSGWAIGGTSVPSSWRFAGGLTHATAAAQVGFTNTGTTSWPTAGTATGSTTAASIGTVVLKGRITVTAAGTFSVRASRMAGTGSFTAETGSMLTVTKT